MAGNKYFDKENNELTEENYFKYRISNTFSISDEIIVDGGVIVVTTQYRGHSCSFQTNIMVGTLLDKFDEFKGVDIVSISQNDAISNHLSIIESITGVE